MFYSPRPCVREAKLAAYTKHLAVNVLEAETGVSPGYMGHGGLSITRCEDRMNDFR